MADNKRLYYAAYGVGISRNTATGIVGYTTGWIPVSGLQSVGIDTTFNLDTVFQLGELELFDQPENLPSVECTMEQVLCGSTLLSSLGTQGATTGTLVGRFSNEPCNIAVGFWQDTVDIMGTGTGYGGLPSGTCIMSGMYVNSINFNMPVDGNFTHSVTFVGNNKLWVYGTGVAGGAPTGFFNPNNFGAEIDSTGVRRRYNWNPTGSILPRSLAGVRPIAAFTGVSGPIAANTLPASGQSATGEDGGYLPRIQSIQVSTDFGRPEIFQLGRRAPYARYIDFPVEVTTTFEIINRAGDKVSALDNTANLTNEPIIIGLYDGTVFDMGLKNKLTSVSDTGGDTGGGNRTTTYTYSSYNTLYIRDPKDIAGGIAGQLLSTGGANVVTAATFSGPPT
jgi:hypothetical protein